MDVVSRRLFPDICTQYSGGSPMQGVLSVQRHYLRVFTVLQYCRHHLYCAVSLLSRAVRTARRNSHERQSVCKHNSLWRWPIRASIGNGFQ